MTAKHWLLAVALLPLLAACGSPAKNQTAPTPSAKAIVPGATGEISLDGRAFRLHVPPGYHPATKVPLVVLLHGYSVDSTATSDYFKLSAESDRRGFLYALPNGTVDPQGNKFWNATDACCDFYHKGIDDSTYLSRLIDTVKASYAVDPTRVYFVGHSNGAFMSYRMACEHADQITAIVSVAGALNNDTSRCQPTRPVSILEIHGTADEVISYNGGLNSGYPYPSVDTTLAAWRHLDGCHGKTGSPATPIDLDAKLTGAETTVTTYSDGCRDTSRVVLWSIKDGLHSPAFTEAFAPSIMDFLYGRTAPA